MSRRDAFSSESESVGAIWASDHFIEQLQANGTYEPTSRTDAALAAALVAWRDEVREAPLSPPPRAGDIEMAPRLIQPHRIARRSVAAAAVLLAMSSAMATALDADPLKPVRYLVDLGVTVGERIADPVNDPSAEEAPEPSIVEGDGDGKSGTGPAPSEQVADESERPEPPDSPTSPPATTDAADGVEETAEQTPEQTDGVDGYEAPDSDPEVSPEEQPTGSGETEVPPTTDPATDPPTTDPPTTDPPATDPPADPYVDDTASDATDTNGGSPPGPDEGPPADGGPTGPEEQSDASESGNPGSDEQSDDSDNLGLGTWDDEGDGDSGSGELFDLGQFSDFGPPFNDVDKWADSLRHEHGTHGRGHHGPHGHDGTMGQSDHSHSDRTDAWKTQAMMFMMRLHPWG